MVGLFDNLRPIHLPSAEVIALVVHQSPVYGSDIAAVTESAAGISASFKKRFISLSYMVT